MNIINRFSKESCMMINSLFFKTKHITLCFVAALSFMAEASQWNFSKDDDFSEIADISKSRNSCDKICIGKVLTDCLKAKQLKAGRIEADNIKSDNICVNDLSADAVCARTVNASEKICAPLFSAPAICTDQLTANNACITGTLTAGKGFLQCSSYRATVVFTQDTPYTLGDIVDYNLIVDDPNNNVTLNPFTYTVPVSGYYILTTQIDQTNLQGVNPIIGTPIANLTVKVNGNTFRDTFTPYLAFHNGQDITVTTLISLNAGDLVSVVYNVYVMDDTNGFTPYVGTVLITGNGSEDNATMFKIHYLSSNCTDLPCTPCQADCTPEPCNIPCVPVDCCNMMECCDK